ncbi:MAG: hypothetical protein K0S32_644 [Bacteroidetes bacterium]|jgi:hypothetical protein|nr:hypothetical protein [Bacteroidota bacterium]
MISSKNVNGLPDKDQLRKICKAISVLDAILSPEWEFRYYSYNSGWDEKEEVLEMRDGEGSHMLVLFRPEGCVINGFSNDYQPGLKQELTKDLPLIFHNFIFGEPVKSIGTTFCMWTIENKKWQTGNVSEEDGSEEMLAVFDGKISTYINWAAEYFETDVPEDVATKLYEGLPLTKSMVLSVNSDFEEWDQLQSDLEEIDYIYEQNK